MKKLLFAFTLTLLSPLALAQDHSMHHEDAHHDTMPQRAVPTMATPMESEHSQHTQASHEMNYSDNAGMPGMDFMHHQNEAGTMTASDQAYTHINHTMHEAMAIEFTGNPDIDFLRGMIPHHQGAIDMAKVQLTYGEDGTLKHLTKRVIRDQNREIRFMKINLEMLLAEQEGHSLHKNEAAIADFKKVNAHMHQAMNGTLSGQADVDFVTGMIPHHEGAVAMAKVVLAHGTDSNARRLAYDIINAQESEIAWMQKWLARQRLMNAR